jgi:transcription antitermination factor NusG
MNQEPKLGDRVRIRKGTFVGLEGEVIALCPGSKFNLLRVELSIFDHPVPVELSSSEVDIVQQRSGN